MAMRVLQLSFEKSYYFKTSCDNHNMLYDWHLVPLQFSEVTIGIIWMVALASQSVTLNQNGCYCNVQQ